MISPYRPAGMGSWFSSLFHSVGNYVAGDGNSPGTPETRAQGYDSAGVAHAAADILVSPAGPDLQGEMLLMGAAGLGLILLLSGGKRR